MHLCSCVPFQAEYYYMFSRGALTSLSVLEPLMHLPWLTTTITPLLPIGTSYLRLCEITVKVLPYNAFPGLLNQMVWGLIGTFYRGYPLTCWWVQHHQQALILIEFITNHPTETQVSLINDAFHDEHMFLVSIDEPLYSSILLFLRTHKFKPLLTHDNQRHICP